MVKTPTKPKNQIKIYFALSKYFGICATIIINYYYPRGYF